MGNEVYLGYLFLQSRLGTDSTLVAELAPGGVHRALAPPDAVPPWVIHAHQAGSDTTTMNGVRLLVNATYQAKAVGPATNSVQIAAAADRIDVLLGGVEGLRNIAVTGGFILSCTRQQPLFTDEQVNGEQWSNIGGLWRLEIEQTS